jgi:hypothetical protein
VGGDRVGGMNNLKKYDEHGVGISHTWTRHAIVQLNCVRRSEVRTTQTRERLVMAGSSRSALRRAGFGPGCAVRCRLKCGPFCGFLRRLVVTCLSVSEERRASFFRVTEWFKMDAEVCRCVGQLVAL